MRREISNRSILDKICEHFCSILDKYCKYVVVSGFVAISSGRTRGTEDIDIIIEKLSKDKFIKLHKGLIKEGFVCMQSDSAEEVFDKYLNDKTSVRYTYRDKFLPEMELMFAKDELDEMQIKSRQKLPITGLNVWFSEINSNVAFKELYLGSDKDLEDAKHLRLVFKDIIDENKINRMKDLIKHYRMRKK